MKVMFKDKVEFKKILIKNGFSQSGFAKSINLSHPHMSQIINGDRCPSAEVAGRITTKLGLTFDDIFFIDDGNNSNRLDDEHEKAAQ
ncbi:helix-turn-helix domain-containing protein [Robertmurraya korlensis]|uniref:helix-turn-helix domain-containing protein n=1 Tax=Robertmurraya korlensis TaxID=519977 RepID=UPI00203A78B4|nr:helix-turn-helix transcriptional regulator [Robertmurraya korlensis]MCM3599357.1 helix-turn-helix domain-containing protein [Robertmurraya korlensis]